MDLDTSVSEQKRKQKKRVTMFLVKTNLNRTVWDFVRLEWRKTWSGARWGLGVKL